MIYALEPASDAHAQAMAPRLGGAINRKWARLGFTPIEGIRYSIGRALRAETWLVDGVPVAMFGVGMESLCGGPLVPWLIATPDLRRHRVHFLRRARVGLRWLAGDARYMAGWVEADDRSAVRFLAWLGCVIGADVEDGHRSFTWQISE